MMMPSRIGLLLRSDLFRRGEAHAVWVKVGPLASGNKMIKSDWIYW